MYAFGVCLCGCVSPVCVWQVRRRGSSGFSRALWSSTPAKQNVRACEHMEPLSAVCTHSSPGGLFGWSWVQVL